MAEPMATELAKAQRAKVVADAARDRALTMLRLAETGERTYEGRPIPDWIFGAVAAILDVRRKAAERAVNEALAADAVTKPAIPPVKPQPRPPLPPHVTREGELDRNPAKAAALQKAAEERAAKLAPVTAALRRQEAAAAAALQPPAPAAAAVAVAEPQRGKGRKE